MINSDSSDITYGGAYYNRLVEKEDCHSTTPADKQVKRYNKSPPC